MTLNHDVVNGQGLRYESFKERVLRYATTGIIDPIEILYPNFLRPSIRLGNVLSVPMRKIYKPYIGKGVVDPISLIVHDFGYIPIKPEPEPIIVE